MVLAHPYCTTVMYWVLYCLIYHDVTLLTCYWFVNGKGVGALRVSSNHSLYTPVQEGMPVKYPSKRVGLA